MICPLNLYTDDGMSFQGVQQYPVRIKCAILAWNALLQGLGAPVSAGDATQSGLEVISRG